VLSGADRSGGVSPHWRFGIDDADHREEPVAALRGARIAIAARRHAR
jgi:hypothetical protein